MPRPSLALLLLISPLSLFAADPAGKPAGRHDALGDPLPHAALFRLGTQRLVQGGYVRALAQRHDGKVLYAAGEDTPLRAWDTATGKELPPPTGWRGNCAAVAASPDGKLLAAAGEGMVRVFDLDRDALVREWPTGGQGCVGLAFAPDLKTVAWMDPLRHVHLHDLASNKEIRRLAVMTIKPDGPPVPAVPTGPAACLAFRPDGKAVAGTTIDGKVVVWDTATGKRLRVYFQQAENNQQVNLMSVAFTPDNKSICAGGYDGHVRFWDVDSLEEQRSIEVTEPVSDMVMAPDGKAVVVGTSSGLVGIYSLETGKVTSSFKLEDEYVTYVSLSRDGKTLAAGTMVGGLRLFDVATSKERALPGVRDTVLAAGFTDNGRRVVTVGKLGVREVELATGKKTFDVRHPDGVATSATLSGDGKYASVTGNDNQLRLIECASGASKEGVKGQMVNSGYTAFSAKGDLLAVIDTQDYRVIRLFETSTGKERTMLKYETPMVGTLALAFSGDGRLLMTGHPDRSLLECWELATGTKRKATRVPASLLPEANPNMHHSFMMANGIYINQNMAHLRGLTFTPDSRHLAHFHGPRVGLWEPKTGKLVRWFEGGEQAIESIAFSPDGRWLVAGTIDGLVRLWDVATGEVRAKLAGHRGAVVGVNFAADSRRFVSASADGTALVWDVDQAQRQPVVRGARPETRPLAELWADLGSDDAERAERAADELHRQADDAVGFLKTKLVPVAVVPPARVQALIAELDSNEAKAREQAAKQLEEVDEQAVAALKVALTARSAEVQKQAKRLVERAERLKLTGAEARPLRAVEVLERLGSKAASRLLEELQRGAATARLTREAEAAVRRLRLAERAEP